jgi:hypothetical protein
MQVDAFGIAEIFLSFDTPSVDSLHPAALTRLRVLDDDVNGHPACRWAVPTYGLTFHLRSVDVVDAHPASVGKSVPWQRFRLDCDHPASLPNTVFEREVRMNPIASPILIDLSRAFGRSANYRASFSTMTNPKKSLDRCIFRIWLSKMLLFARFALWP